MTRDLTHVDVMLVGARRIKGTGRRGGGIMEQVAIDFVRGL
jgi:hypothetical protein